MNSEKLGALTSDVARSSMAIEARQNHGDLRLERGVMVFAGLIASDDVHCAVETTVTQRCVMQVTPGGKCNLLPFVLCIGQQGRVEWDGCGKGRG